MKTNLVLLIILIMSISACQKKQKEFAPGVSKELAKTRKQNISNLKYQIQLFIPAEQTEKIEGYEKIELSIKDKSKDLVLDFRVSPDFVKNVKINGNKTNYSFRNEHIIIPSEQLSKGTNSVEIDFTAGDQSLNRNKNYLYTLFVPDRASTAIPCFDQPDMKAEFKLTLKVPLDWTAVSNGKLEKTTEKEAYREIEFDGTRPISTYLFAFVAGKFDTITRQQDGRKITLYHREEDKKKLEKNVDRIFELQFNSLEWLEDYTAIDYPFKKYDLVAIPSFQYSGMEHPGSVYYRDSKIFLDQTATIRDKLNRANLVNHETAHMWFGDLVTMEWFNEVWLKEVFANFIADKITQPQFPDINHNLNFLLNHFPSSYSVDRTQGANPIQQKLSNLKNAGTLYGSIIYHKAPIVMKKLENQTGEELMKEGLREYLSTNNYGTATWSDLITILDKSTDNNLAEWSKIWVHEPGMPHIKTYYTAQNNIRVVQKDRQNKKRIWPQELVLKINGETEVYRKCNLDKSSVELEGFKTKENNANYILTNAAGEGYGYFQLDDKSKSYFLKNVSSLNKELERAAIWIDLWENLLNNNLSPEEFQHSIINQLPKEKNAQCVELITGYLNTNFWKFLETPEKEALKQQTEETLWSLLNNTQNKELKSTYFNTYRRIAFSEEAVANLYALWKEKIEVKDLSLSTKDYTNLAFEIMLRSPEKYDEIKTQQKDKIKSTERKERFEFISKAMNPKQEARDDFFESLKNRKNRAKEPWVTDALHYLHHPIQAKNSIKYIQPSLKLLPEIQKTGDIFFPKSWAEATLWGHSSKEAKLIVENFLTNNPDFPENLKLKILQSADMLYRAVDIKE